MIISIVISSITSALALGNVATMGLYDYADPSAIFGMMGAMGGAYAISWIWSLVNLIPGLAISVRRLHDIGKNWYWIFINLIPFAGIIIWLVLMATASKFPPNNKFGVLPQL